MSIILDALRRASSEQGKRKEISPRILGDKLAVPRIRKKHFIVLLVALVLVVSISVVVFLSLNKSPRKQEMSIAVLDMPVQNQAGETTAHSMDSEDVKAVYKQAINSDNVNDMNHLAAVMFEAGSYHKAIAVWQASLKIVPQDPRVIFNLGVAYEKVGSEELAINTYHKALEIDANFVPALINLGNIFCKKGLFMLALGKYETALKISPNDIITHYNLGVLHARYLNRKDKAIYHFERYLSLSPQTSSATHIDSILSRLRGYK